MKLNGDPGMGLALVACCVEFTKGLRKAGALVATVTYLPKSYLDWESKP